MELSKRATEPFKEFSIRIFQCHCEARMILVEAGEIKRHPELLDAARSMNVPLLEGGAHCPSCDRLIKGQWPEESTERRDGKWTSDGIVSPEGQAYVDALNRFTPKD